MMKSIYEFDDSSDDEEIVEKNPYENIKTVTDAEIKLDLTLQRLKNIKEHAEILGKLPQAHQELMSKPAIQGRKKPGAAKKSNSDFPAPLAQVKTILDAVPSSTNLEHTSTSIIPSFRGLKWSSNMNSADVFFSTRADWKGQYNYASQTFIISKIDINQHTRAFCLSDQKLLKTHHAYDLNALNANHIPSLNDNNERLQLAAQTLKQLFKLTDVVCKSFSEWKAIFGKLRHSTKLMTSANNPQALSLSQILSYIYVNGYEEFKLVLKNLDRIISKLDDKDIGVIALKKFYNELPLPKEELAKGMPYLSEGQIPRHALLYAFGLKVYTKSNELEKVALYTDALKPKKNKVYLGKVLVTNNPHSLFHGNDKAFFVPDFDKKYGDGVIGKTIIGEREIQHQGANLQGKINQSINIKLPKFHHENPPQRYLAKYGLSENSYRQFKETFKFLISKNEHGKLSWMYLETVLLAHLVHFHERQLFKSCNQMATETGKAISWFNRDDEVIENPFTNAGPR